MIFAPGRAKELFALIWPLKNLVERPELEGRLVVFIGFLKPPTAAEIQPLALIFFDGPEEEARKLTSALFDLGPVLDMVTTLPFDKSTDPNPLLEGPPETHHFQASNCPIWAESDLDVFEEVVKDFGTFADKYGAPVEKSKAVIEIRSHAKTSSIPISATAFAARRPVVMTMVEAQYDDTLDHSVMRQEIKGIMAKAKTTVRTRAGYPKGGAIFNANIGQGDEQSEEMFGENLPRLRALKKKYDPNFIFKKWHPITPAE